MSIFRLFIPAVLLALLAPASSAAQGLGQGSVDAPVTDWAEADPDSLGLNTAALEEHRQLCEDSAAVACLVAYRGVIVQEWKRDDYDYGPYIGIASATKSITSLLMGILLGDEAIGDLDDPISDYIPEWQAGVDSSVTLRHLMTMTAGIGRRRPFESVLAAKNTTEFALGVELDESPGDRWIYTNESAQLLSPIIEAAAGMPAATFARERLFGPLGMFWTRYYVDEYLNTVAFGGIETTLREFGKIGQLVLNDGRWNGEQIVPASYIENLYEGAPQNPGYSLLWWTAGNASDIWAAGDGDRILAVLSDDDLVAVRLQRIATVPGTASASYFNDRGRMHAAALDILRRVVPE